MSMGFKEVDVESDSLEAVNLNLQDRNHFHLSAGLVDKCMKKFQENPIFSLLKIRMGINEAADYMAKISLT